MNEFDTLIHNGVVVTVNPENQIIPDGMLGISGDKIALVTQREENVPLPRALNRIDARGGIILPGLVNTHTHLPMSLFRGLADDLPLEVWLNEHIFPAEAEHIHPESVRIGTLLSCVELLLAGTTTCCDGYFLEDQVAAAVAETGIRAVLGQGVVDFPAPGVPDPALNVSTAAGFVRKWSGRCETITPSIFCHSPYTCCPDTLVAAKAAAAEAGVLFQIHAAETRGEAGMIVDPKGSSPIAHLDELGILDQHTLLVHAVWADDMDIHRLQLRRACISHNPDSNMKLAAGVAPVPQYLTAGLCVGLGTDGCASNNNLDMFQEMDMAAKLHKVYALDPVLMPAESVLRMATLNGARAIGLDSLTGSLETGKLADVVVVDTRSTHLTPMYHPVSHLVYAACGSDVRHVFVGGRHLVSNGSVTTVDTGSLLDAVNTFCDGITTQRSNP
ncbi:MAG: amidohydrolase [Desulfobacteraceae bacterium]|nr:amidohydrolase [Desulfobacteraceae bacterium]